MPQYRAYIAPASGSPYTDRIEAPSVAALRAIIEARGDFLLEHKEQQSVTRVRRLRLKPEVQIQLFDLLSMQLGAGVVTEAALFSLKDEIPDTNARAVLRGIHASVTVSKNSLSAAFAEYPRSFPGSVVSTIAAGEEQGMTGLSKRFADLRDALLFRLGIRQMTAKATAYPIFIICFATGVVIFLLIKLVPQLKELLDSLNTELPWSTRAVVDASAFAQNHWLAVVLSLVASFVLWKISRAIPTSALWLDRLLLAVPLVGGIYKALVTAEVAKNYRALYLAGLPPARNFTACSEIVRNRAVRASLIRARRLIENGSLAVKDQEVPIITEALRSTGYFPSLALTIIKTGELLGGEGLAQALEKVSDHYNREAHGRIARFFAIFDKALFIFIGALVGFVLLSMFQPIASAIRNIR